MPSDSSVEQPVRLANPDETLQALFALRKACPSSSLTSEWEGTDPAEFQGVQLDRHGDVAELYLGDAGMQTLPPEISLLRGLQKLWLQNNALRDSSLPHQMSALVRLQHVMIGNNQLTDIPQLSLCKLTSLVHLLAPLNALRQLSPAICHLTNLEWLDISENAQLDEIPSVSALTKLTRLDMHSCRISALPEDMFRGLSRLQRLSLHANALRTFAPDLASLRSLKWLSLNSNELKSLGDLACCTALERISLHINRMTAVPESIGSLVNLEALSLHSNPLTSLPSTLGNLHKCARLSLYQCELQELPAQIGNMTSLQELWLYRNHLQTLPPTISSLQKLRRLWLDANHLTQLPDSFSNLTALQDLYLEGNPDLQLSDAMMTMPCVQSAMLRQSRMNTLQSGSHAFLLDRQQYGQ